MNGVRIIASPLMVDQIIDFSACRSPSRAARRLKRGIQGRVVVSAVPKTDTFRLPNGDLVMHPVMAAQLREKLKVPLPPPFFGPRYMLGSLW